MGPIIDPLLVDDYSRWLEKAHDISREMAEGSNEVTRFRWSELQQLDVTIHAISQDKTGNSAQNAPPQQSSAIIQLLLPATSYFPTPMDQSSSSDTPFMADNTLDEGCGLGPMLSSAEMMAMANYIEMYDAEWVSSAMINHNIW
jgi:hypothetical protein